MDFDIEKYFINFFLATFLAVGALSRPFNDFLTSFFTINSCSKVKASLKIWATFCT